MSGRKKNGQKYTNNSHTLHNKEDSQNLEQNSQPNLTDAIRQTREVLYEPLSGSSKIDTNLQNMQTMPTHMGQGQCQDRGHVYYANVNTAPPNAIPVQPQYNQQCAYQPIQPIQQMQPVQPNIAHPNQDNGIPPWAASLCQQMVNLQSTLNGQTERWQSIEKQIESQNVELAKMQTQLTEISQIKRNLENTNSKLITVEDEVKTIRSSARDYDKTLNQYSDLYDDLVTNNCNVDKRLRQIESKLEYVEKMQIESGTQMEHTNDRVTDLQWRSMRENLLFCGIQEARNYREEGENCELVVKQFIRNELEIESDIQLDRCHRIGRYNRDNPRPRPIIAKFTFFKDKESVKQIGQQKLKNSDFWIKDQYPKEMEEKRKTLYPVADEARKNTENKVSLVRDRLYINGKQYRSEGHHYQHRQNQQQSDYRGGNRSAPARYNNADNRNAPQESRTFYRRSGHNPMSAMPTQSDVTFKNRFSALASATPDNRQNRSQLAGKKKATSPLEDSNTFKKQHFEDRDNESDRESDQSLILIQADVHVTDSQSSTQPPQIQCAETDDTLHTDMVIDASCDQAGDEKPSHDHVESCDQADDLIRDIATETSRDPASEPSTDA